MRGHSHATLKYLTYIVLFFKKLLAILWFCLIKEVTSTSLHSEIGSFIIMDHLSLDLMPLLPEIQKPGGWGEGSVLVVSWLSS